MMKKILFFALAIILLRSSNVFATDFARRFPTNTPLEVLVPGDSSPVGADYLVGTADGDLSAEIVVGTTPGGELGGTWASPTIDDLFLKLGGDTTTGNYDFTAGNLTTTGTISNLADNSKHIFGLGSDASIYYDGTDFIFDSQEVGTGDFLFKNGDLTNPQPSGASGIEGERFGRGALDSLTTGNGNTAFGFNALTDVTNGADNVAIGSSAAANVIGGGGNVALGTSALFNCTTGNNNMAIGKTALQNVVSGGNNVAIGESALQTTTGTGNIGIGASTIVTPITSNYSIMIGYATNATAANQCVIGSNSAEITQFYLGNGVTYSNPQDTTLNATGGSGTDIAGADLGIAGGKATGNAAGGSIRFQTSDAGASGTTLQTLTTKADIVGADLRIVTDSGKVILGTGQDASITFDSNSMNIIANEVTATDDLEIDAGDVLIKTDLGISDDSPMEIFHDSDDDSAYAIHHDSGDPNWDGFAIFGGTSTDGKDFNVGHNGKPYFLIDESDQKLKFPNGAYVDEVKLLKNDGSNADQNIDIGAYSLDATGFDAGSALITNVLNPTTAQDAATKEYVDTSFEGIAFDFFLNNTASNISTYFVMDPAETGDAESSFSDTITNDDFTIDNFATVVGEPTFTEMVVGVYTFHLHASTTVGAATDTIRLFFELYKRAAAGGAETLLITSEESSVLTSSKTSYEIHGSLLSDEVIASDDRFVLRVKANIDTDRSQDSVTTFFAEGTNATRFEARTTVSAFDDRYVQVAGDTMTGNLAMGTKDITGVGTVTADALTMDADEPITLGGKIFDYDSGNVDFEMDDDLNIKDADPHIALITDVGDDFEWYAHANQSYWTNLTDSKVVAKIDSSNQFNLYEKYAFPDATPIDDYILKYDSALGRFVFEADAGGAEINNLETVCTDIADTEIFIGTGADTGNYAAIGGEATMSNAGAVTLADSVAVTGWNLTTPTITTSLTTDSKTISEAEIGRLDGLAGIIVTDVTSCTDLEGTLLSISGTTLNATEAQDLAAVCAIGASYAGTITADGLTMGADEPITLGTAVIDFDTSEGDVEITDDVNIKDTTPHLKLVDTTASEDDFEMYADGNQWHFNNFTDEKEYLTLDDEEGLIKFFGKYQFPDDTPEDNELLVYDAALGRLAFETAAASGDMSYSDTRFVVGSFTRDQTTASGTQTVSGIGFTPVSGVFFSGQDGTLENSYGIDDGTISKAYKNDNGAAGLWGISSQALAMNEQDGDQYNGKIDSWNSDGFVVDWTKENTPSGTATILYLVWR